MKNISVLGITGSIGNSFLTVLDHFKAQLNLISILVNTNIEELLKIIKKYSPEFAVVSDEQAMKEYFGKLTVNYENTMIYSGVDGFNRICDNKKNDIILNGVSGSAGLKYSIRIVENGINLALANKESVVCAGKLLFEKAHSNNCKIIPVDSEHSAIFSLLKNYTPDKIKNIYLTASGGPFYNLPKNKWDKITISDALKHPTWDMGQKISIDSATLANKGLEVIEAHFLFNIDYDKIKVLIHPQSLIHSMIETIDGEIYAQIGPKDMSIPIQNAIFYPKLQVNDYSHLDLSAGINLELFPVDLDKFKMLQFAYNCGTKGAFYPAFYNFVNEKLVNLFLTKKIAFVDIEIIMEKALALFSQTDPKQGYGENIKIENVEQIENSANLIIEQII